MPLLALLILGGGAAADDGKNIDPAFSNGRSEQLLPESDGSSAVERAWGIKIAGIRTTAGGYMLDFRFRVVDPAKAGTLLQSSHRPYLIDQASGRKVMVPSPPKVGQLRNTLRNNAPPVKDRVYFVIFANPAGFIKPGGKVTVVIGEFKATDLIVT